MFVIKPKTFPTTSIWILLMLVAMTFLISGTATSCQRKSGCPVNEQATAKADRKGNFKKKKGGSDLFPKDMRKKIGN